MKDFKYLTSVTYSKKDSDDKTPPANSNYLRRSLDFHPSIKFPKRPLKTADQLPDLLNLNSAFPYFRPRSPITNLAKSIQISKLSRTLNGINPDSPQLKPDRRGHSVLQGNQFMDLVNPHTPFKGSFLVIKKSEFYGTAKKNHFCKSIEITNKTKLPKKVKLETLNIRDIKDKKWLIKKHDQILHDFFINLNKSNGLKVVKSFELTSQYKYFIGKGNNSKLIKSLMSKRHGWSRVKSEDFFQVNFIWTEWLSDSLLSQLPSCSLTPLETFETPIAHSYHYKQSNYKRFLVDISALGYQKVSAAAEYTQVQQSLINPQDVKIYSKLKGNHHLSNKKELFANLEQYCRDLEIDVFEYVPVTFHMVSGEDCKMREVEKSVEKWAQLGNFLWIVKPGEDTNRGAGIVVCSTLEQIKKEVERSKHTSIVQKYVENLFLVNKRKFDIRVYCLVTCFNGVIQGYYYNEGYLRTSSKFFSLNLTDKLIHLTNDAVQKRGDDYGRYENGNKMSYNEFQKYLEANSSFKAADFNEKVLNRIREIVTLAVKSTAKGFAEDKKNFSFEVFGFDFLVDSDLKPWLLEANTNPCLEISSSHLARIIPNMIDNALQIALDSIFQIGSLKSENLIFAENRFELIYHSQHSINQDFRQRELQII